MGRPCPVCAAPLEEPFLERRGVPVLQNILCASPEEARGVPRGDLVLAACPQCDFVANVAFEPELMHYGEDYENLQACSPFFEGYVDELVDRLVAGGVDGLDVVEVGCGTGYFLSKVCERGGARGVGFDTAYRGPAEAGPVRFVTDVFDERYADVPADLVVCRHVIEHVPDPVALLHSIRRTVGDRDALVVFETPALEWILDHAVSHDLFYEHCSYFSEASITVAFQLAGFRPVVVERLFGGQYLWVEARPDGADAGVEGGHLGPAVERFEKEEARQREEATRRIDELVSDGAVAVWGVGAKGVTFLNLVDPSATRIACAVDVNPRKQGLYVAGTGHPITGVDGLVDLGVGSVLLMNPNYLDECRAMARDAGADVELLTQETCWR